VIAFFSLRAVESTDPWEKIEIDAATRALAEQAAAAAGLSIEKWLERAIERAGASIVRAARIDAPPAKTPEPESERESESEFDIHAPQLTAAALDAMPVIAAPSAADIAEEPRAVGARPYRWALMAAGIVVAIAGGVVSAQYLIPDRQHAVRVALEPSPAAEAKAPQAQEAVLHSTVSTAAEMGLAPPAAPPATAANAESAAPVSAIPVAPAPLASASSTLAPSPAASQPTMPAAAEPSVATPSALATPATKTPPASQDAPRKIALAKPPAAPGPVAPRTSPNATAPDATAKADKAEAPTDPQLLAPWLEARAKTGDAISQYRLGVLYALGEGVTQDYQRAASLFKTAAEDGVTEAEYNVAVMYAEGLGIGRDPNQAVYWYRKAASQGSASAAFNLGVAYSNGVGVERSMEQAAQWFRRAAEAGVVNAQFNIGLLFERGEGVSPSLIEAFGWYAAAAARGDTGAAQRRDRLVSTLSPAVLKDAQARAAQIEANLQNSGSRSTTAPVIATPAAHKP
jgi:TPR repeat protein